MNTFENDYSAMVLHKSREQELMSQAENERKARTLREEAIRYVRRIIRSDNNPVG